jgi:hypothetical protein
MTSRLVRPTPPDPLPLAVIKLGRKVERGLQDALRGCDITAIQLSALLDIARHPEMSRAKLARELRLTPQAIGGITAPPVERVLVTRSSFIPCRPTAFTRDGPWDRSDSSRRPGPKISSQSPRGPVPAVRVQDS